MLLRAVVVSVLLLGTSMVQAQPVPGDPEVHLEIGRHTAPITGVAADRTRRYLLTGSRDKTARVWDRNGPRLIRVLRPPHGPGAEGEVHGVALSPDGGSAALWVPTVGGVQRPGIHLFDTRTGELLRTLTVDEVAANGGPPRLTYSEDGRLLRIQGDPGPGLTLEAATGAVVPAAPAAARAVTGAGPDLLREWWGDPQGPVRIRAGAAGERSEGTLRTDNVGTTVYLAGPSVGQPAIVFTLDERTLSKRDYPPATLHAVPCPDPVPAHAWACTLSGDRRLLIAAHEDGVVRWYAAHDPARSHLLSLYAHTDGKRWIAWTPSGDYDSSIGGEELLGWQVNRRQPGAADFFTMSLFRERHHRPDVIALVLFTQDDHLAAQQANARAGRSDDTVPLHLRLPPIVTILSPADFSVTRDRLVQIRVRVRSPSGRPVTSLYPLVHGRFQSRGAEIPEEQVAAAPSPDGQWDREYTLMVQVPPEDCTVTLRSRTALSQPSEPARVHLRWEGAGAAPVIVRPSLRVLAAGVGNYQDRHLQQLEYPAKDARDLAMAFREQQGRHYRQVEVRVLVEQAATRQAILDGLSWLSERSTRTDVAVVFLAGHGVNDESTGRYHYVPYEGELRSGRIEQTMLSAEALQEALRRFQGRVLLFLDTCHAGNVWPGQASGDLTRFANELSTGDQGIVVYAASTGTQISLESPRWGNGAFTKAIVEGLRGQADYKQTGEITISTLHGYVSERVRALTRDAQTPTMALPRTVPDFALARSLGRALHRRWWFWGIMAGVTIAVGVGLGVGLPSALHDPRQVLMPGFPP